MLAFSFIREKPLKKHLLFKNLKNVKSFYIYGSITATIVASIDKAIFTNL